MAVTDLARPANGLATADDFSPRFVVSLSDLREQIKALDDFKKSIMQEGTDYDVIPGTKKPSLLKPGAEKLATAFGHVPRFHTVKEIQDWEGGFFYYQVECVLVNRRTGLESANGLGSCNTKESRYRWRTGQPVCPNCQEPAIARGSEQFGGGFYCNKKNGGCAAKFKADDARITSQPIGRVENDDPYTLDNTVLKMAQKRSLVAAVLVAFAASAIFTQDVEDYPEIIVNVSAAPPREPARPAPPRPAPAPRAPAPAQTQPVEPEPEDDSFDALVEEAQQSGGDPSELHALWLDWEQLVVVAESLNISIGPRPPKRSTIEQLRGYHRTLGRKIEQAQRQNVAF